MQLLTIATAAIVAGSTLAAASSPMDAGLVAHGHLARAANMQGLHHRGMTRKARRKNGHCQAPSHNASSSADFSSEAPTSSEASPAQEPTSSSSPQSSAAAPSKTAATNNQSLYRQSNSASNSASATASHDSESSWSASSPATESASVSAAASSSTPSSSSSSSSSGSSSGSSSSSGSGKFPSQKNGLAWANGPWVSIQSYKNTMGWLYSWDAYPATGNPDAAPYVPDSIDFYPMLWSNAGNRISDWQKYVLNDRHSDQNKAKVAMGPNEVNQAGQGEMSSSEACDLFRSYIMPLKYQDDWTIIGASTNGAPAGFDWMNEFKSNCADVWNNIDADSLHFYGTNPDNAIAYFEKWHNTYGKPIYITETACENYDGTAAPNLGQAYYYIQKVNDWAHSTDYVKGIAFYGAMEQININSVNRLSTSSGSPTDLFNFWVNNS